MRHSCWPQSTVLPMIFPRKLAAPEPPVRFPGRGARPLQASSKALSHPWPTNSSGHRLANSSPFPGTHLAFPYSIPSSLTTALTPKIPHFPFCLIGGESLKDQPNSARPRWICLPSQGHSLSVDALLPCHGPRIRMPALELDPTQLSHQLSELLYLDLSCLSFFLAS